MESFEYTCKATLGLQRQTITILATECTKLKSTVTIAANGKVAQGNDVLALVALRAGLGDKLVISAEGPTEEQDIARLKEVFSDIIPIDKTLMF